MYCLVNNNVYIIYNVNNNVNVNNIFITGVLELLKQKSSGKSFIAKMERVIYFIYLD